MLPSLRRGAETWVADVSPVRGLPDGSEPTALQAGSRQPGGSSVPSGLIDRWERLLHSFSRYACSENHKKLAFIQGETTTVLLYPITTPLRADSNDMAPHPSPDASVQLTHIPH